MHEILAAHLAFRSDKEAKDESLEKQFQRLMKQGKLIFRGISTPSALRDKSKLQSSKNSELLKMLKKILKKH